MGRPLESYYPEGEGRQEAGLWVSQRCEVCDLAFQMGKSEEQFYREFGPWERSQLLATYRSQQRRTRVVMDFPERGKG